MRRFLVLAVAALTGISCHSATEPPLRTLDDLTNRLESLRKRYTIPALAAGIAEAEATLWFQGLGQTPEGTPPTARSVFHLASLTKPFAAAVVLQLEAEGKLSLQDNVSTYGLSFPNSADVRVVHLLTHTSDGVPGQRFSYNGNRFAALDRVIERASGKGFVTQARERIIEPLGLACTGPSNDPALRERLLQGFGLDGTTRIAYPEHVSSAAGFVSCVEDLFRFSAAFDAGRVLPPSDVARAWTAMRANDGSALPYAFGWFVTEIDGQQVVWHYGDWIGISSLIIKIPARRITYVLLANNERLSVDFRLGAGDLLSSPFARAFLEWAALQ